MTKNEIIERLKSLRDPYNADNKTFAEALLLLLGDTKTVEPVAQVSDEPEIAPKKRKKKED